MGKRIISLVGVWAKLAIVISLVLIGAGTQNEALAVDSHSDLSSVTIVVAIDRANFDCASVADPSIPHRHKGQFDTRNCCGSACSICAILASVTAVPVCHQKSVEPDADCPQLASVVEQNFHRPPIT
jgi:hypothetical protein